MTFLTFLNYLRLFIFIPMRILYWPFMLFPIQKNKIVFSNFNGRGYGCNPKYICEYLIENYNNLDLVWMTSKRDSLPPNVRNVDMKSFRALWEFATAKVWVCNNRLPFYIDKKKSQFYLQTWHGCLGFKHCEAGIKQMPIYYKIRSKHDSKMMNLLMMNSDFAVNYFKKVFWYDGPIMCEGSARNDKIVNGNLTKYNSIRDYYHISYETKILLYCPTFRQNTDLDMFKIPFDKLVDKLKEKFSGDWVVFVRLHPVLASKSDFMKYSDSVINVSSYDDFQDLLVSSDICLTDYSSGIFDFMLSRRPTFFYAPDYDNYKKERDFVYNPEDLPCPLSYSFDDLLINIDRFDADSYSIKLDSYFKYVGIHETGKASEYLSKEIIKHIV